MQKLMKQLSGGGKRRGPRRIDGPAMSRQKGTTMTDDSTPRPTPTATDRLRRRDPATPTPAATPAPGDRPRTSTRSPGRPAPATAGRVDRRRAARRGRLRWAVAIAVVALVIVASAAVAAIITGRSTDRDGPRLRPGRHDRRTREVRLDLPGDQRQAVGAFLSKFPGFADQAALETKLDEVLDQLVKDATDGEQTYTSDIKPWFDGELAFALGPLPDRPRRCPATMPPAHGLVPRL